MTDAELVRAIRAGDGAALEVLYRRYLPSVWRYACAQLAGDVHAAEDVTSETFLAAVRSIRTIDPEGGSVAGWLVGIARHKVSDHRRRVRRRAAAAARGAGASAGESDPPAALAERAETRAAVARVMEKMADDERLALEWKYLEDLSVREIARRLNRTEKSAEAILYRARRTFREMLERERPCDP